MTKLNYMLYRSIWKTLDLVFPPVCVGCGRVGFRWCDECQRKVKVLNGMVCEICGLPQEKSGVCDTCQLERPHFYSLRAWAVFDGPVQSALHRLKYRRDISLGDEIAGLMIPFVQDLGWKIDMVVPIPLGKHRMKERGYNQVAMIAKPLAMALGARYSPTELMRRKETRSQVGLSKVERKTNVSNAFQADQGVSGKIVLVMDDVSTTGSTLSSSADALYQAGAKKVYALTAARALPHHDLRYV